MRVGFRSEVSGRAREAMIIFVILQFRFRSPPLVFRRFASALAISAFLFIARAIRPRYASIRFYPA
jgi:hypothetical protein